MTNVLIVLYNKKIEDSLTFNCLKNDLNKIKIIIFDNGNEKFIEHNEKYASQNNIIYYTLRKNVGISKAYNYVIKRIDLKDEDYIIMLDDDTNLNSEYINEAIKEISAKTYDIILPKIKAGNMYISPAQVQFNCRIHAVKSFDKLNQRNISAINSGMIIRTSVFNKIRYNEKLFLDYVDHDFMRQARKNSFNIKIMDATINQNFSRFQKNDIEKEMFRFKIYLRDFKEYCKEYNNMIFYHISVLKYKMHQVLKYKRIKFLFVNERSE